MHTDVKADNMVDYSALQRACAEYARIVLRHYDVGDILDRLADQITEVLQVSGAGAWLGEAGRLRFVTATDPELMMIEEVQSDIGEGPSHQAWRSGELVVVHDLRSSRAWPAYAVVALAAGQRAVTGIPMTVAGERIGAVSIYHASPHAWPPAVLDVATLLTDMAAGYIVNQRTLEQSQQLTRTLQRALDSRVLVEQAKGILAERHDLDVDAAFERLRDYAHDHDRTLHAVARAVVEGTLDPLDEQPFRQGPPSPAG